jgi:hypothetical protein
MSRRGNEILRSYEARIREEKDHQTVTQGCLWCHESFVGELCDARDWFTLHLSVCHPDKKVVKRKYRQHASRFRTMGTQPLETNIANARLQGASTWVNDGETI